MDSFGIVKDSSIWQNSSDFSAFSRKDNSIRIGIIKKVYRDGNTGDLRYLAELRDANDGIELNCRLMRKFGGVFNYEDTVMHGYKFDDKPDPTSNFAAKAGDVVLIALLNGQARDGIILGCLTHPARTSVIDIDNGPQFASEFNGIETLINQDGEYTVTFKGIPTNIDMLDNAPASALPAPTYDTTVGTSFYKFDKTGSFEVNDNSQNIGFQNLRIDKAAGTVAINSGKVSLLFTKAPEQVDLKAKVTNIVSDTSITASTQQYSMSATTSAKVKSPKVAIGTDGIELLDQLSQLIDAIGKLIAISPVGPCNALMTSPEWSGVAAVQTKIKEITGSF
jgi:hypothetical protein